MNQRVWGQHPPVTPMLTGFVINTIESLLNWRYVMNTKTKGNVGELLVMLKASERGYTVCVPYGDNDRYDLVLDLNGVFSRVQVKYITPVNGKITLQTWTVIHNKDGTGPKYKRCRYSSADVDLFAVVNASTHEVYMIPTTEIEHLSAVTLRVTSEVTLRKSEKARDANQYKW